MESTPINNNSPVQVSRRILESLTSLAGELVLGRNQLLQGINNSDPAVIETSGQSIDLITSEIQNAIMQTRMQPVASLFESICQKLGDRVILDETGKEIMLDRTILDAIRNPLNALADRFVKFDAGAEIENSNGDKILLKAFQDAGQVNIVLSADRVALSATDIPEHISSAIEELGGAVDLDSIGDKGCAVTIKLPLTLAIIPGQMISIGNEKFAVPQTNLSELLRIQAADTKNKIQKVGEADVIRLRGELLPLLNLSDLLDVEQSYICPESGERKTERRKNLADRRSKKYDADGRVIGIEKIENTQERVKTDRRLNRTGVTNIAIVFAGNYKYGLVVEQFYDSEEIVVKPVGRHLKTCKAYAGATIMGDGKVSLILDILNLAQMVGVATAPESRRLSKKLEADPGLEGKKESLVMFKNMETEYFAASFKHVQRIERFKTADIEKIEDKRIIQYRGNVLRLYEISEIVNAGTLPEKEYREVIVFNVDGRTFGLIVSPPVDILDVHLNVDDGNFDLPGIKGTMNINGHTTLVMDMRQTAQLL
ncbi:MAG: chemotaxis protein CheW [Desulfobacterales bacterium]|nr:chemotaxis protein CheW [Desulfobacterales bacterium]